MVHFLQIGKVAQDGIHFMLVFYRLQDFRVNVGTGNHIFFGKVGNDGTAYHSLGDNWTLLLLHSDKHTCLQYLLWVY